MYVILSFTQLNSLQYYLPVHLDIGGTIHIPSIQAYALGTGDLLNRDDGNCCCTLWRVFLWVDNWKKGLLYIGIAIPTFTEGIRIMLAVGCGEVK